MKDNFYKNITLWFVIALIMVVMFNAFNTGHGAKKKISYTEFIEQVKQDNVKTVIIKEKSIAGELKKMMNSLKRMHLMIHRLFHF